MHPLPRYLVLLPALLTLALDPLLASAAATFDTGALLDRPNASAAQLLRNHGYRDVHTANGTGRDWVDWWNEDAQDCLVTSQDSRHYVSVQPTTAEECRQYLNSSGGSGTGLAVAAGAAALIGAVALYNHNKHRRDKEEQAQQDQDQYDRGYQDAIYHRRRDNRDRNDAYDRGYDSGVADAGYRHDEYRGHRGNHGYVEVSDLVGARAAGGESELRARGFRNIDGDKGWHRSYTTWWNARADECVQVVTRDGRYSRVEVVGDDRCA
ncbi:hypothetical protein [Chitiniphilus shinanonensis]|uniref:hypothetical protein n=1 Tax=Chitiniphilus shinanonensis TaxID=553088 RepID=UPI00306B0A52